MHLRLTAAVAAFTLCLPGLLFAQKVTTVKGSTTMYPLVQAWAEEFHQLRPEYPVTVTGGGSGFGLKALLDGSCEIASSSRPIRPEEQSLARQRGKDLAGFIVAYDAVVPIVHSGNPVADLTMEELKAIYRGDVDNWADLGGPNLPIAVVSRETSSGTYEIWNDRVMGRDRITRLAVMQASNARVVDVVSKNPAAVGYVGLEYLSPRVKALSIGGVSPENGFIRSGAYPTARPLYLYAADPVHEDTQRFLEFTLSASAQKTARRLGFIPAR